MTQEANPKRFFIDQTDEETSFRTPSIKGFLAEDRNPLELLTRKQVAAEYGIPVKALERYAWAGGGPHMVKLGHRTVRYRRGEVEAFIAALGAHHD